MDSEILEDKAAWGWQVPSDSYQTSRLPAEQSLAQCGSKRMRGKSIMMVDSLLSHGKGKKRLPGSRRWELADPQQVPSELELEKGLQSGRARDEVETPAARADDGGRTGAAHARNACRCRDTNKTDNKKIELFPKTYHFTRLMSWYRM
jgi:hypothetical protein